MNLQGIVAPYIAAINPTTFCIRRQSIGYVLDAIGKQSPLYNYTPNVPCQIQPMSGSDLQHIDTLNQQGVYKSAYITGPLSGVNRTRATGGDLLITPDGEEWLITQVLENWNEWTKAIITLQVSRKYVWQF